MSEGLFWCSVCGKSPNERCIECFHAWMRRKSVLCEERDALLESLERTERELQAINQRRDALRKFYLNACKRVDQMGDQFVVK